jgi:hypothetical protein
LRTDLRSPNGPATSKARLGLIDAVSRMVIDDYGTLLSIVLASSEHALSANGRSKKSARIETKLTLQVPTVPVSHGTENAETVRN